MWSKTRTECAACESTEWKHKARGICQRCYPLTRSIEKVGAWDESDENSLNPIPGFSKNDIHTIKGKRFGRAKEEILNQLRTRLRIIRNAVNPEDVDGLALEYSLESLAEVILKDGGRNLFRGHAKGYNENFSENQRAIIMQEVNSILLARRFLLDKNKIFFTK